MLDCLVGQSAKIALTVTRMEENLTEAPASDSAANHNNEETSKEKNVDDRKVENWVAAARENMSKLLTYSATRYTRILLISDVDQTLSKQVFREDKRARKVVFMEEPLSGPGWDGKNNCVEGGFEGEKGKNDVKLNRQQEEFLKQMVKAGLFNVILSGSSGTGNIFGLN